MEMENMCLERILAFYHGEKIGLGSHLNTLVVNIQMERVDLHICKPKGKAEQKKL
jgi:hypothetical protein